MMTGREKLVLAAAAGVAVVFGRRRGSSSSSSPPSSSSSSSREGLPPLGSLRWPLPTLVSPAGRPAKYSPEISDGFRSSRANHVGADIMYRRYRRRSQIAEANSTVLDERYLKAPQGTELYWCPVGVPVRPAAPGVVWSAGANARGGYVLLDHGHYTTYYGHLSALLVPAQQGGKLKTVVSVDDSIGLTGGDPSVPPSTVHLHFEIRNYPAGLSTPHDPAPFFGGAWELQWR